MNKYRSKDEEIFANKLNSKNIKFEYEPTKYVLVKGFPTAYQNYRDITYTPDFEFEYQGRKIIIEVKGYMQRDDSLKVKLASLYFEKRNIEYYVIRLQGSIKLGTKNFYFYNDPTILKKKNKKTFWERVGVE